MGQTLTNEPVFLQITKVTEGSRAHSLGLLPFIHAITLVNGQPVGSQEDVKKEFMKWKDQSIRMQVLNLCTHVTDEMVLEKCESGECLGINVKVHRGAPFCLAQCVVGVDDDSPAMRAGLVVMDDYVVGMEGVYVPDEETFLRRLYECRGDECVLVVFNRRTATVRRVSVLLNDDVDNLLGATLAAGLLYEMMEKDVSVRLVFGQDEWMRICGEEGMVRKMEEMSVGENGQTVTDDKRESGQGDKQVTVKDELKSKQVVEKDEQGDKQVVVKDEQKNKQAIVGDKQKSKQTDVDKEQKSKQADVGDKQRKGQTTVNDEQENKQSSKQTIAEDKQESGDTVQEKEMERQRMAEQKKAEKQRRTEEQRRNEERKKREKERRRMEEMERQRMIEEEEQRKRDEFEQAQQNIEIQLAEKNIRLVKENITGESTVKTTKPDEKKINQVRESITDESTIRTIKIDEKKTDRIKESIIDKNTAKTTKPDEKRMDRIRNAFCDDSDFDNINLEEVQEYSVVRSHSLTNMPNFDDALQERSLSDPNNVHDLSDTVYDDGESMVYKDGSGFDLQLKEKIGDKHEQKRDDGPEPRLEDLPDGFFVKK